MISCNVFATKQRPDTIRIDNQIFLLNASLYYNNPVLDYYLLNKIKAPFQYYASNCSRGHIATYSIINDSIFITQIQDNGMTYNEIDSTHDKMKSVVKYSSLDMDTLFKIEKTDNKLFVNWFDGYLIVETIHNEKRRISPCSKDTLNTYESDEYILIKIEKGKIAKQIKYDNFTYWSLLRNCDVDIQNDKKKHFEDCQKWIDTKSKKQKYWIK